jgi:hypothetical protein
VRIARSSILLPQALQLYVQLLQMRDPSPRRRRFASESRRVPHVLHRKQFKCHRLPAVELLELLNLDIGGFMTMTAGSCQVPVGPSKQHRREGDPLTKFECFPFLKNLRIHGQYQHAMTPLSVDLRLRILCTDMPHHRHPSENPNNRPATPCWIVVRSLRQPYALLWFQQLFLLDYFKPSNYGPSQNMKGRTAPWPTQKL